MLTVSERSAPGNRSRSWLLGYLPFWRTALLLLLLLALAGPWFYDQINVPAEYSCSAPFVRLEGDFCGLPVSGLYVAFGLMAELFGRVGGLLSGAAGLPPPDWNLLWLLAALLILLPVFSALLMIPFGGRRRLQVTHLAVSTLAASLLVLALSAEPEMHTVHLWGPWLYLAALLVLLILEGIAFAAGRRMGQAA